MDVLGENMELLGRGNRDHGKCMNAVKERQGLM